jgi:mono/diheme cytochrome c family protein
LSNRRPEPSISRGLFTATALLLTLSVGCWEQWSDTWFPQMKRQKAIQAFETVQFEGQITGFSPPDGTVPIDGGEPMIAVGDTAAEDALENPRPMSLASLDNGKLMYDRFCATCHGMGGLGDGPVSMMGDLRGPFVGVLAVAGPASIVKARSDGSLYTTIRNGRRRMPDYKRIAPDDRWDIVNYLRYLNGQKGIGQ